MPTDGDWFFALSLWILLPASAILLIGAAEIGRRLGKPVAASEQSAARGSITILESTTLGLLSLMIGFTYSMSLERYDKRSEFVLEEANAIGTTEMRAHALAKSDAERVSRLIDKYIDVRLSIRDHGYYGLSRVADQSLQIQEQLRQQALAATIADPRSVPAGLFLQAVGELIDVHEKRLTADQNHVPTAVFMLLYLLALIALGFAGYSDGVGGVRSRIPSALMGLLLAVVIVEIADLDELQGGLITVSQAPILRLQQGHSQQ